MKDLKGFRNEILSEGDTVVYGKSDRHNPLEIGKIIGFTEDDILILRRNIITRDNIDGIGFRKRASRIPKFHSKRLIVVPEEYLFNEE